jgi:hypothetical protein
MSGRLRNPRSFRPEPEDEEPRGLNRQDHMIIEIARANLRETIGKLAGKDANQLALLVTVIAGMFADLVSGSAGAPMLIAAINQQLAHVGLVIVETRRN